jgi:hypothetical protein
MGFGVSGPCSGAKASIKRLWGPSGGAQNLVRYRKVQGKLIAEASLAVRFVPLVHPPALKAVP